MGGYNGEVTTEIFQNGSWSFGPTLPNEMRDSCATQINSTHTMITGGYSRGSNNRVGSNKRVDHPKTQLL